MTNYLLTGSVGFMDATTGIDKMLQSLDVQK